MITLISLLIVTHNNHHTVHVITFVDPGGTPPPHNYLYALCHVHMANDVRGQGELGI